MKIKKWTQNGKLQIDQIKQLVFKIYLSFFFGGMYKKFASILYIPPIDTHLASCYYNVVL